MTKARVLQWNMDFVGSTSAKTKQSRLSVLDQLLIQYEPTIVSIQEGCDAVTDVFRKRGYETRSSRLLYTAFRQSDWMTSPDQPLASNRANVIALRGITSKDILVCNVHFSSRKNTQLHDRQDKAREFVRQLLSIRRQTQYQASEEIILGDFNLEPFNEVMFDRSGFFSNRSLAYTLVRSKKTPLPDRPMFNPCWQIYGVAKEVQGTYYKSGARDGPWYVFDQVLLSHGLAVDDSSSVDVIAEVGKMRFVTRNSLPDRHVASDHLPLVVKVNIPSRLSMPTACS